jgi:hypothetical protein
MVVHAGGSKEVEAADKLWADSTLPAMGYCSHRLCSKVLMRRRKSVGTVRRAGGVRRLFDEDGWGSTSGLGLAVDMAAGGLANGSMLYLGTA